MYILFLEKILHTLFYWFKKQQKHILDIPLFSLAFPPKVVVE